MNNIFHIYRTDWKRIFSVPTVALLIAALMLLPSAYAWFNIKAMWDPYGNTSGIKIAVANEDKGAEVNGTQINVGEMTVHNLKGNHKLGWFFVDKKEAETGVENGKYYAYIKIPHDFSKKLVSILEANPQKPQIDYGVNEKINAIAPKITSSGASSVTAQISEAFIKMVGNAIFSEFYKAGVELQRNLPSILSVENQIFELEKALPEIEKMGQLAIQLEAKWPEIHQRGQQVMALEQRIPELNKVGDNILKVEASLPIVKDAGNKVLALQNKLTDLKRVTVLTQTATTAMSEIEAKIQQAIDSSQAAGQASTSTNQEQLASLLNELRDIHGKINQTQTSLEQDMNKVTEGMNTASNFFQKGLPTVEQKIHKAADFVRTDLPKLEKDIRTAAELIRTKLPEVEKVIHKTANFSRNDLPGFEEKVRLAADRIRKFENSVNINDLIEFLKHDPQKESSFLSNPVLLKTRRIFPIPNYGSAMSPFYTMLALWVGATLLVASLRVDVEIPNHSYRGYQTYAGRLLTFLSIGVFQALIVSLGDLFILHTYVADKLWFVLLCIFISIVFVIITYTLCSVFGNIGKGMSIILLVLQISSSGATFPVSLASSFFQKLNPFMPFTYAVSMLRETVGGMILSVITRDILFLLVFMAISFLVALVFKKPLSKWIEKTAEKAKTTKLIP